LSGRKFNVKEIKSRENRNNEQAKPTGAVPKWTHLLIDKKNR
jgi:hypothetical protein